MNTDLQEKMENLVGEIVEVKKLDEQGGTSEVHHVLTNSGSFLLKSAYDQRYREWLKAEAEVLEKLNGKKIIPVPDYFGFMEDGESSHLITSFIEGLTLTAALKKTIDSSEQTALIRSFGRFLNQLHETKEVERLFYCNYWLGEQLAKAEKYVQSGQTDGSSQLLETLKSNRPLPVIQTMIHGDCTTDNVLVVDGEVRYFIDLSGMTIGDPRYDESLAIGCFEKNLEHKKAFYDGYKRYKVSNEEFTYFNDGLYEFF